MASARRSQTRMRELVFEVVTEDAWRACLEALLEQAQQGNLSAFKQLEGWVMGALPKDTGDPEDGKQPTTIVVRRPEGIVSGSPRSVAQAQAQDDAVATGHAPDADNRPARGADDSPRPLGQPGGQAERAGVAA
jgi:hypothetical protein